jgi:hypothetical protein
MLDIAIQLLSLSEDHELIGNYLLVPYDKPQRPYLRTERYFQLRKQPRVRG